MLLIHPAPAPYRVDLFNRLATILPLRVLFLSNQLHYDSHQDPLTTLRELIVEHRCLTQTTRINLTRVFSGIKCEIREFEPEVIVCHEFSHATLSASMHTSGGGPHLIVWTSQNAGQIRATALHRWLLSRFILQRTQAVLSYSPQSAQAITETYHYPANRVFQCANHQSTERLRLLADAGAAEVRKACFRLGLNSKKIILTIGRLAKEKNHETVLRAFSTTFRKQDDTALCIIGDGDLRNDLKGLAHKLGISKQVRFLGQQHPNTIPSWHAVASLHVLASTFEPYGAVVGEALAVGVPSIVSNRAGSAHLADALDENRTRLFDPANESQLGALMLEFAATFRSVQELSANLRPPLACPDVSADANGFISACVAANRRVASPVTR